MVNQRLHRLIVEAKADFGARAMWWMRDGIDPDTQWPVVVKALRTHGGHAGMRLAQRIEEAARASSGHWPSNSAVLSAMLRRELE